MRSLPGYVFGLAGLAAGAGLIALLPADRLFTARHDHTSEMSATGERWACPMMDFIGSKPGSCPVCGMALGKVTAGELTVEQQRRMGVELSTIQQGPARTIVRAYGSVNYDDRTMQVVIPRVAGRIVKRHDAARHAGTDVKAGDPVVDLYSPEVFAAQGELAAAVKLDDRPTIRALTDRFERWNLPDVARAILDGGAPVDTITIRSTFSGRVVLESGNDAADASPAAQLPQVGQEIVGEAPLIRLVDPDAYMVIIFVPESRAHFLRLGQPAKLASDDRGPLHSVEATIAWLAPELNREIRSREVHIHLRDVQRQLLPGSLVQAEFETVLTQDLQPADLNESASWGTFSLVPKTAILSTGVRNIVWRVTHRDRDGRLRFEPAPVALGPRIEDVHGNDVYVVRAGLNAGDQVATQGVFLIDSQAQLAGTPSLLFPTGATGASAGSGTHQH